MKQAKSLQFEKWIAEAPQGTVVYLLGAGGCGMSGLGHLLLDHGLEVAGSDLQISTAAQQLLARGADIQLGHSPAHMERCHPALVVYTSALRTGNPALERARRMGIPLVRRATLLAALMHHKCRGVCVAGMHGKTTTTALLVHALIELGAKPSYAVGGEVTHWERPARLETGDGFFVVETDESDGTLREFYPEQALVLNVDEEHLDYYANLDAVCEEFSVFAGQASGLVFYCADDPQLVSLFAGRERTVSFGFSPSADYCVESLKGDVGFALWYGGVCLGEYRIRLTGEKNFLNAAAAAAFLHYNGFQAKDIATALGSFSGVGRRQQNLFDNGYCRVIDDYGHHPREIEATLSAVKQGGDRVLAAFQPHRYTRTQHLLKDFAGCFADADRVWITEVYSASEPSIPEVNGQRLAMAVAATGAEVSFVSTLSKLREQVGMEAQPGDVVLFLGAGDITRVAHQVAMDLAVAGELVGESLRALLSETSEVRLNEPMSKFTMLRVGGPADVFVVPDSEADLSKTIQYCKQRDVPFFVLGRGSNLLVRDGGIRGVVISLAHKAFSRLEVRGERLFAGAGVWIRKISQAAKENGVSGFEFLEGIPGTLGGALRMNAGAMQSETFDVVESIRIMDCEGKIYELARPDIFTEYRSCPTLKENIAIGASLRGETSTSEAIAARMKSFSEKRIRSQPKAKSAGCIFKNPSDLYPAGRLVDELGLKGVRVGGAMVSGVHGNFIVNENDATAADVLELIEIIQERARVDRDIELHAEVQIVGE